MGSFRQLAAMIRHVHQSHAQEGAGEETGAAMVLVLERQDIVASEYPDGRIPPEEDGGQG